MERVSLAFDAKADAGALVKACSTADGIRSFWTDGVDGDAGEGSRFTLTFPGAPPYVLETTAVSHDSVGWKCVEGPEAWVDTSMAFGVAGPNPMGEGTLFSFNHDGWAGGTEGMLPYIAYIWAQILDRLKATMENGSINPFFVNG